MWGAGATVRFPSSMRQPAILRDSGPRLSRGLLHAGLRWISPFLLAGACARADGLADSGGPDPPPAAVDHVLINEIMAENTSTLRDSWGEYSDWLELYNATGRPQSLAGMYLTDDPAVPRKSPLPDATLAPWELRLVFLSGRNAILANGEWHAGFRLSREGEYLALTGPEGVIHEFAPTFGAQLPDVSFGLVGGDPARAGYLSRPSPLAPNGPDEPVPTMVSFSRESGLITTPFLLEMSAWPRGARIQFQRGAGGVPEIYTGPILIDGTTRITARAAGEDGAVTGPESTAAWIMPDPSLQSYESPLPVLVIDNFGAGTVPQKGWTSNGANVRQVPRQSAAWIGWDRLGETARPAAVPSFFTLAGIRGRGAYSSSWRQKPYSVEVVDAGGREAKAPILGMPEHADWVLYFPDPDPDKDPTLLFNTFVYDLSRRAGRYAPRFRWVELFLNEDGGNVSLSDRRGVYAVLEKVARGDGRLDFEKLSPDGRSGGWLLSINRMDALPEPGRTTANGARTPQFFRTAGPNRIADTRPNVTEARGDDIPQQWNAFLNFGNPGGYDIASAQRAAIEGWFRAFEDVLYDDAAWRDPAAGYRQFLDARDFAEYFVFNVLTRNGDGLLLSMYPWKGDDGLLRMGPAWDYNWSSYYIGGEPRRDLLWRSDQLWYGRLFQDPDFRQLYIDRWTAFRRGPMSDAGIDAIIDVQAAEISTAKAVQQGVPSAEEWRNRLNIMKSWLKRRAAWIDSHYLPPPEISPAGGIVPAGSTVSIRGSEDTILYSTADGSDPRGAGRGVAPSAGTTRSFVLLRNARITARQRFGPASQWSAPASAVFVVDAVPATPANLTLSEIHYHPAPPSGAERNAGYRSTDFEFVELRNTGDASVSLAGLELVEDGAGNGIRFRFDDGTVWSLAPGERVVVVRNRRAFGLRYGDRIPVAGEFSGSLRNSGDTITLATADGAVLQHLTYSDSRPWPAGADGRGPSLELVSGADPLLPSSWRAGFPGGTPGAPEPAIFPADDLVGWTLGGYPLEVDATSGTVFVRQRRRAESAGIAVTLQTSTDLRSWKSRESFVTGEPAESGGLLMEWSFPTDTARFVRLHIEQSAPD